MKENKDTSFTLALFFWIMVTGWPIGGTAVASLIFIAVGSAMVGAGHNVVAAGILTGSGLVAFLVSMALGVALTYWKAAWNSG